jgi:hypothetical protein
LRIYAAASPSSVEADAEVCERDRRGEKHDHVSGERVCHIKLSFLRVHWPRVNVWCYRSDHVGAFKQRRAWLLLKRYMGLVRRALELQHERIARALRLSQLLHLTPLILCVIISRLTSNCADVKKLSLRSSAGLPKLDSCCTKFQQASAIGV